MSKVTPSHGCQLLTRAIICGHSSMMILLHAGFPWSMYPKYPGRNYMTFSDLALEVAQHHFCCYQLRQSPAHSDSRWGYTVRISWCEKLVATSCCEECSLRCWYEFFTLLTLDTLLRWTSPLESGGFDDHLLGYNSQLCFSRDSFLMYWMATNWMLPVPFPSTIA